MSLSKPPRRSWVRGGCIGRGSFGTVSLAVDDATGELFAVKSACADPIGSSPSAAVLALENEIDVLKSIAPSPYVVAYLGDDVTEEPPAGRLRNLHMEYVPGGTAADLAADGFMADGDVRLYTKSVLEALRHLHSAGVVHGDVKGRNVLVSRRTRIAKLADFGSASRGGGGGGGGGCFRGTPLWVAPEVARGGPHTAASDVWSLGCTVIEMAAGRAPWAERGFRDAARALLHIGYGGGAPVLPAQLPKAGRDFVEKCLSREPSERWSCEELLRHPYVAGAEGSPRSMLDWANAEFDTGRVGCSTFGSGDSDPGCETDSVDAAKRLGELAGGGGALWLEDGDGNDDDNDDDEWEVVRSHGAAEEEERVAERSVGPVTSCFTSPPPCVTATRVGCFGCCGHLPGVVSAREVEPLVGVAAVVFRVAVFDVYPLLLVSGSLCGNSNNNVKNNPCLCSCWVSECISSPLCCAICLCYLRGSALGF